MYDDRTYRESLGAFVLETKREKGNKKKEREKIKKWRIFSRFSQHGIPLGKEDKDLCYGKEVATRKSYLSSWKEETLLTGQDKSGGLTASVYSPL